MSDSGRKDHPIVHSLTDLGRAVRPPGYVELTISIISNSHNCAVRLQPYNETHETPLPNITPHILRHTFVSRPYDRGIDVKCLQMVVGHSNVQTTLNVYTHIDYEKVEQEFHKVTANALE